MTKSHLSSVPILSDTWSGRLAFSYIEQKPIHNCWGLFFSCEEDWGLAWLNQEITKDSDSFFSPFSSWVYGFLLYNPASCMYSRIREGSHKEERLSQTSGKQNFSNSQQFSVNMLLSDVVIYCKRDWGI